MACGGLAGQHVKERFRVDPPLNYLLVIAASRKRRRVDREPHMCSVGSCASCVRVRDVTPYQLVVLGQDRVSTSHYHGECIYRDYTTAWPG
ncbi:hypothetical protein BDN72DRAFT_132084 [Pluteus cervinus]|uniref:Uncharacterized protein n=1 Tax=Pluteus cervinus TaxID=181527 RepID=A0ACD3ALC7_9AGAR|nr:hypothetical protein BDN72DRAFT_132084 [Pluteus cervinus]